MQCCFLFFLVILDINKEFHLLLLLMIGNITSPDALYDALRFRIPDTLFAQFPLSRGRAWS
jgi:hypothetical protein